MLLPAIVKPLLLYGGLAVVALGVLFYMVARDKRNNREGEKGPLPEARIVGSKDPDRIWRWLPFATIALGVVLAALVAFTTSVIIVSDDGTSVTASRKIGLFDSTDYKLVPGHKIDSTDPTWVVNRSSRAVKIQTVQYGRMFGWGRDEPTVIPPNTAITARRIDHIGPTDPPPSTVQDSTKLGMDWRYWLNWD